MTQKKLALKHVIARGSMSSI